METEIIERKKEGPGFYNRGFLPPQNKKGFFFEKIWKIKQGLPPPSLKFQKNIPFFCKKLCDLTS